MSVGSSARTGQFEVAHQRPGTSARFTTHDTARARCSTDRASGRRIIHGRRRLDWVGQRDRDSSRWICFNEQSRASQTHRPRDVERRSAFAVSCCRPIAGTRYCGRSVTGSANAVADQASKRVRLKAGFHRLRVEHFERNGEQALQLAIEMPDGTGREVTADMLFH